MELHDFFGLLTGKKVLSMLGSPTDLIEESWSYSKSYLLWYDVYCFFNCFPFNTSWRRRYEIPGVNGSYRDHFEHNTGSYFSIRFRRIWGFWTRYGCKSCSRQRSFSDDCIFYFHFHAVFQRPFLHYI